MNRNEVVSQLSTSVSLLVGHQISPNNIHTDRFGWFYQLPAKALPSYRPVIISNSMGDLVMIIPDNDFEFLKNQVFTIDWYINNSVWSYGYCSDINSYCESVLYRFRWQPLESKGIHDKERVSRYLSFIVGNHKNPHHRKKKNSTIRIPTDDYEESIKVEEVDDRIALFAELSRKIFNQFGFESLDCNYHDGESVVIIPNKLKNIVDLYLPQRILIDILCNPGKYNIPQLANSLVLEIGIPKRISSSVFPIVFPVTGQTSTQDIYEIWKRESPDFIKGWFSSEDSSEKTEKHNVPYVESKTSFVKKVKNWFKRFFHLDHYHYI